MKKVTYEFEVPDFCPEQCKAFNPFEFRERLGCLNDTKCEQLYRHLKEMEERASVWSAASVAGGTSPAPTGEMTAAVLGFAHALEEAAKIAEETEASGDDPLCKMRNKSCELSKNYPHVRVSGCDKYVSPISNLQRLQKANAEVAVDFFYRYFSFAQAFAPWCHKHTGECDLKHDSCRNCIRNWLAEPFPWA